VIEISKGLTTYKKTGGNSMSPPAGMIIPEPQGLGKVAAKWNLDKIPILTPVPESITEKTE
jgi:hypothetical protein